MPTKIYPPRAPRLSPAALKHPSMRWAAAVNPRPEHYAPQPRVSFPGRLYRCSGCLSADARPDLCRSRPGTLVGRQPAPLNQLCIWISNPVTIAPLFLSDLSSWSRSARQRAYLCFTVSLTWEWFSGLGHQILLPLMVGSAALRHGVCRVSRGYLLINFLWRWKVITQLGKAQAGTPEQSKTLTAT